MQNLWNDEEAKNYKSDLEMRVYTSNLLGRSDELVLHGGGNTSVKTTVDNEEILLVKGSGWDLVSIKAEGFAPVKMATLLEMAKLETLSDSDMVSGQKNAMIDKSAPNPSVEAILHAIIPFKVVDHTHADAIVTISNSQSGIENIKKLFPNFLIVPYVMPGFILAKTINDMIQDLDWSKCEGIILHNHGIFTFDEMAQNSYDKMIDAVTLAENFLSKNAKISFTKSDSKRFDFTKLQEILSKEKGHEVFVKANDSDLAFTYSSQDNLKTFASRGVLTPEHIIRTKRIPLIVEDISDIEDSINSYKIEYKKYFDKYSKDEICLSPTPNYIVVRDYGIFSIGKNEKETNIINDIIEHTMMAVLRADKLGGYKSISEKDSFEMEYWELEQAKLRK